MRSQAQRAKQGAARLKSARLKRARELKKLGKKQLAAGEPAKALSSLEAGNSLAPGPSKSSCSWRHALLKKCDEARGRH